MAELRINGTVVRLILGELHAQEVDAIIHSTNNYLWFSPASERIKLHGGAELEEIATQLGPIEVGQAVAAPPGRLHCQVLIHAAAWGQDMMTSSGLVRKAVLSALNLASDKLCRSVALTPVGTGVGGFRLAQAIEFTFFAIVEHCMQPTRLSEIRLVARDAEEMGVLNSMIESANHANPDPHRP